MLWNYRIYFVVKFPRTEFIIIFMLPFNNIANQILLLGLLKKECINFMQAFAYALWESKYSLVKELKLLIIKKKKDKDYLFFF